MLDLRPRTTRPRYREYPPNEIPFSPLISSSNPFRILDLPIELIDRVTSHLPPRTLLNLALTCHAAYDLLIPLIYRTIDITSSNRLLAIFASPNISHLVLIDQHIKAFRLSLALDGQALRAIRQAITLCPSGKLFHGPTTIILSQKARWSLIDYPQYASILRYFSSDLTIHVKWSGPSRIPHHFSRLFENFGQIASACQKSTLHLHLKMNEFLHMPANAVAMFRLAKSSDCTIRIYVHPNLKRAGVKERKEIDVVSRLERPLSELKSAFLEGRKGDQEGWDVVERSIRSLYQIPCGENVGVPDHRLAKAVATELNPGKARLEVIFVGIAPEQIEEVNKDLKRQELPMVVSLSGEGQVEALAGGAEAAGFGVEGRRGRSGCTVCKE